MARVQLNKNQRRKLSIFLKCVLFSFFAWILFAVSNTYLYYKPVRLEYINLPDNRAFQSLQSDSAVVSLEATGWQLLFSSLQQEEKAVQVDLSGLQNRAHIIFSNQLGFINRQFPTNHRVVSVQPDTLFFDFSAQTEKRVPVELVAALNYGRQFGNVGPVEITPEYVMVRGPAEDIRQIESFPTDTLQASGVSTTLQRELSLQVRSYPNLKVYPEVVTVQVPVGEMTEKVVDVPIEIVNDGAYRSVKLLPGKVQVTMMVSLEDYAQIGPESFRMIVDMQDWELNGSATLAVKPRRVPEFVRLIRMEPQNVDFYVNK